MEADLKTAAKKIEKALNEKEKQSQRDDIAVCKKVRTGSKIEKELKVKKWEQLTQKI